MGRYCYFHNGVKYKFWSVQNNFDFLMEQECPDVLIQKHYPYFCEDTMEYPEDLQEDEQEKYKSFYEWYFLFAKGSQFTEYDIGDIPEEHEEMFYRYAVDDESEVHFTLTIGCGKEAFLEWIKTTYPLLVLPSFDAEIQEKDEIQEWFDDWEVEWKEGVEEEEKEKETNDVMVSNFSVCCLLYQMILPNDDDDNEIIGLYEMY